MTKQDKAKSKQQAAGGLRGKQAVDAVIFHLRLALYHRDQKQDPIATQHLQRADEIFSTLPPDRKGVVNMVRDYLKPFAPQQPLMVFTEYALPQRPGKNAKFVSVPLSPDELAAFKKLASQSPEGNMAGMAATLIRRELEAARILGKAA